MLAHPLGGKGSRVCPLAAHAVVFVLLVCIGAPVRAFVELLSQLFSGLLLSPPPKRALPRTLHPRGLAGAGPTSILAASLNVDATRKASGWKRSPKGSPARFLCWDVIATCSRLGIALDWGGACVLALLKACSVLTGACWHGEARLRPSCVEGGGGSPSLFPLSTSIYHSLPDPSDKYGGRKGSTLRRSPLPPPMCPSPLSSGISFPARLIASNC
jgi:hypothetical protein